MICLGENTNFLPHTKLDFSEATNFHWGNCLGCLICSYGAIWFWSIYTYLLC